MRAFGGETSVGLFRSQSRTCLSLSPNDAVASHRPWALKITLLTALPVRSAAQGACTAPSWPRRQGQSRPLSVPKASQSPPGLVASARIGPYPDRSTLGPSPAPSAPARHRRRAPSCPPLTSHLPSALKAKPSTPPAWLPTRTDCPAGSVLSRVQSRIAPSSL